jgi:iron complex outermembrane receptor protein
MSSFASQPRRLLLPAVRAQLLVATSISILALTAICAGAQTPGSQPQQLPTVPVQPPAAAPKAAQPKAAPKAQPKQAAPALPIPAPQPPPASADTATALGSYNPALDLRDMTLPPGTTLTTAGPVQGYRALSAMSSTKTATPIEQIPQSIQVIPRSVIQDQGSQTVSEALRNVSNVQGANPLSIGDISLSPLKIRGFGAEQWLDGLPVPYNTGDRDSFANVERIEVLKGPSAILYGGGAGAPIGGAVNVVSKLPTDKAGGELGFKFGSHQFLQPFFDINQPITPNGTVLFRITGEYTSADSFIDVLESDRYTISPTLTLTNKVDTTLTLQGRISKAKQQTYQGLPVEGTIVGDYRLNREMFIGPSDIERSFSENRSLTLTLDHRFNSFVSANLKARWSESRSDQNTQLIVGDPAGGPLLGTSTWGLANAELFHEQQEFSINPNLTTRFSFGDTKNTVLVGADYSRVKDKGVLQADYLGNACAVTFGAAACFGLVGPTVDLLAPSFTTPYLDPRRRAQYQDIFGFDQIYSFNDSNSTYTTKGVYGQVQSTLYDRIHLLGGVRLANVHIDYFESAVPLNVPVPTTTITDETKALPRVGAVVDILPGVSVFASYSEGLKGVPSVVYSGPPKAEESKQSEAGLKFNIANQLSGTIAVFEIDRKNVPVSLGGLGRGALGHQESRGYEADLIWQPTSSWQFLANYGYVDAKFADGLQGVPAGNKFAGVPEHSGRVWLNYKLDELMLKGWSVGAGVYLASSQFVDNANKFKTDGYHTVDAKIAYDTKSFSAALFVKNLTKEEYFVPYAFLGREVAPGDDRAIYGLVTWRY